MELRERIPPQSRFPDGFRYMQGKQEYVTYRERSTLRVWYSETPWHYETHYHSAVEIIMPILVGLTFIIVGNLLPKCRRSYTLGIKLPWTLASDENWNKTHRVGGKTWVIGGVFTLATSFLGSFWLLLAVLVVMVGVPTVYSYWYYQKFEKNQ